MPFYRFCRPDNIPFLVRAVNACYNVHFPASEPLTVEGFRTEMKELDVWPSNCLVAGEGDDPIAVLVGTKRRREVLVLRLGVHPDHQRQGHALHLLSSLRGKLAVLGPERLVAEVPGSLGLGGFLERAGYRREVTLTDYHRPPGPVAPVPEEWVIPTTVAELRDHGLLAGGPRAWERAPETLANLAEELRGVAIASPERLEAYLLWRRRRPRAVEVLALDGRAAERRPLFLGILLRYLAGRAEGSIRWAKLAPREVPAHHPGRSLRSAPDLSRPPTRRVLLC